MRLNVKWTVLLSLMLVFGSNSSFAIDHGPMIYSYEFASISPGRVHLSSDLRYLTTKANYDTEGGSYEDLPNGGEYVNISGNIHAAYDVSSTWRVLGGLRLAHANSDDGTYQRKSTELNEITTGLLITPYYQLQSKLYLEAIATIALNTFEYGTDEVLTGEGAHNVSVGGRYSHYLKQLELLGTLHVQWFDDERSTRLPWRVGGVFHLGNWKLIGSIFGFQSILDDEATDTPADRTNVTTRVNASSLRYNSVNPNVVDTQAGIGWQPYHDVFFEVGLTKTINGKSFAESLSAYLSATLYWGGNDGNTTQRRKQQRKLLRKKSTPKDRFKTKQEQYDETLFESDAARRKRLKQQQLRQRRRQKPIDVDKAIDDTINEFD